MFMTGRSLQSLTSDGSSEITLPESSERNMEMYQTQSTILNSPIVEQRELEEENANTITELRKTDSLYLKRKQTASGDSVFEEELKFARNTNKSRRTSAVSGVTTCPSTPFHGFVPPEMTIVPDSDTKLSSNRKAIVLSFRDAIPVLPLPVAVLCLVLNILVPGLGKLSLDLFYLPCLHRVCLHLLNLAHVQVSNLKD